MNPLMYLMNFFITVATAVETANLLLPGFQGHDLQASILFEGDTVTTYLVTCPTTVNAIECGIPGPGMTAIAGPTYMQLENINPNTDAYLSCEVKGTTHAFCHASKTISAEGTLAAKDLNWMKVPVIPTETNIAGTSVAEETAILIVDGGRLEHIPWLFHILYATSFFGMYICVLYVLEKRSQRNVEI